MWFQKYSRKFINPLYSFVINLLYFPFYIHKWNYVKEKKNYYKSLPIEVAMKDFIWTKDSFKDWNPWIYIIIARKFKDDCDGAATFAKWHLKQNNIESNIISLFDKKTKSGHAICVTKGRTLMISNNEVYKINSNNWEDEILSKFKKNYEILLIK